MKAKQNIALVAGGGVAVVLIGVVVFLLYGGIISLVRTTKELETSRKKLKNFYGGNPFPSEENVAREKENVQTLKNWYGDLTKILMEGQVDPDMEMSPSLFVRLFGRKKNELRDLAKLVVQDKSDVQGSGVKKDILPEHLGFSRYFVSGSPMPSSEDVPRLTQQLIIIERLCKVFLEEKVEKVMTITRDQFEGAPVRTVIRHLRPLSRTPPRASADRRTGGSKKAGIMGKDARYAKMHFGFEFMATENSVLSILNRLADHGMFIAVTSLQLEKQGEDVKPVPADRGEENLTRVERLVCGLVFEKPLKIKLELDVYRFTGE